MCYAYFIFTEDDIEELMQNDDDMYCELNFILKIEESILPNNMGM